MFAPAMYRKKQSDERFEKVEKEYLRPISDISHFLLLCLAHQCLVHHLEMLMYLDLLLQ